MNSGSVGSLSISDEPAFNEAMFESSTLNRDNRIGIALGSTVGSDLLNCEALPSESANRTSESMPTVSWIRNGHLVKIQVAILVHLKSPTLLYLMLVSISVYHQH